MSDVIFTDGPEPVDPDRRLNAIEEAVEAPDTDEVTPVYPLGRSWARDFTRGGFVPYGAGPLQTTGLDTLRYWVEKCCRTARGAHAIYSDEFGVEDPTAEIGEPLEELTASERAEDIAAALTRHPRIDAVEDFLVESDPDEDYLTVSFTVRVNGPGGGSIDFEGVQVGGAEG